ncbi:MAG: pantetheine-phosphate adenylyltransferase [Candidatus Marinimicrobia bacterium]|nr:pantetheine-phosphate adenylyltransferase [Candidatus Neomarinimicrobiota bacterium]
MHRTAIYPGTFDPITNGHLDIIKRAVKIFDTVIVAVANNVGKAPLFTIEQRVEMIKESVKGISQVEVDAFNGLIIEYCQQKGATALIRGLRAISDFEYEFQMALINRKIGKDVESVFLMPKEKYTYLSSSIIKEIAAFGGDVSCFVPDVVKRHLNDKYAETKEHA